MEMEWIDKIMTFFGLLISGGLMGFIFSRKREAKEVIKIEKEVDSIDISNQTDIINLYKSAMNDLSEKVKILDSQVKDLMIIVSELRNKNLILDKNAIEYEREIDFLKKENLFLHSELDKLKK